MSEKLFLQWNDFQEHVKTAFGNLKEDKYFTDVTLVCEDGQQLEAHKVILSASSPFFRKVLERSEHPHPLIYMRGLKSNDLVAIVDFLYFGEASVFQEDLDGFLALAEDLKLKGLTGASESSSKMEQPAQQVFPNEQQEFNRFSVSHPKKVAQTESLEKPFKKTLPTIYDQTVDVELGHLDDKVFSMMQQSENWIAVGSLKIV